MQPTFDPIMFMQEQPFMFLALVLWALVWKGLALWKSAKYGDRNWFIVILILNTVGVLEIFYLYFIVPRKHKENS